MEIRFEKVNHYYKGSDKHVEHAISDIDLNISDSGEFIAVCGHTGSGKSTLVQHMNALLMPTSGKVYIGDTLLPPKKRGTKINHIRRHVGLVFQFPEYQLFEETVLKDIAFGPKNFKEKDSTNLAINAARLVGLKDSLLESSPFLISGGEMRKTAIAGVLAINPRILVLDEPTRGLDPKSRDEIMEVFAGLVGSGKTIVMITHDMNMVAKYAKRVVVLKDGYIVFDDDKTKLFSHPNFNSFHLDLPETIKITKYLHEELGIPYKEVYFKEELIEYLKEYYE